jgi:hypothetical protein
MFHEKILASINKCYSHLGTLDKSDTSTVELEALLVSSLIILIVSEYEIAIEELFIERAGRCGDSHVIQYVKSNLARKFRSPDLGKINEVLGQFGRDYRASFTTLVINTEYHAAWDNIMTARHAIVHKNGSLNITLGELIETYPKTKVVFDHLKAVLGLV